ncbi:hypothetical protein K2173_005243 [Erythroxylum novogranatense]|uniref:Transmembrane protein n=1 Tax=Erythroxylum novogranatense TaxID=1862640 RepID=A0AAV8TTS9_9ROSI|nr:hypothetical protein K2173_005243 [Erythroxylum novogranatense]
MTLLTHSSPRITTTATLYLTTVSTAASAGRVTARNSNISFPILSHSPYFHYSPKILKISSSSAQLKPFNSFIRAYQSDDELPIQSSDSFSLDAFLSVTELLCVLLSAVVMVSYALNKSVFNYKRGFWGGNKVLVWGVVVMVGGMAIGSWIRRRQWRRICGATVGRGGESVNLVGRIEKLEEDLRSSATLIRVMSRQLEKLGIRFRVTRKALKHPIAETAALAQRNSEATRALAIQEDILEKELKEIQKVLLAMQEQQQKQLELILAIGKTGKLWESRQQPTKQKSVIETSDIKEEVKRPTTHETEVSSPNAGGNNDRL